MDLVGAFVKEDYSLCDVDLGLVVVKLTQKGFGVYNFVCDLATIED